MKLYLEAKELRPIGDPILPEFVRVEVTDNTESERAAIFLALKDVMSGLSCTFTRHSCGHEDSGICNTEVV